MSNWQLELGLSYTLVWQFRNTNNRRQVSEREREGEDRNTVMSCALHTSSYFTGCKAMFDAIYFRIFRL